jgi:cytochrome c-type biogenesis protein CcmH/NrfG
MHYNLGNALKSQGKPGEAVGHYLYVLKINPNDAEAHDKLGNVLIKLGEFNEAIGHFRQALRLKSDYVTSLNGLAWVLTMHPDVNMRDANEAITLAECAAGLTGNRDAAVLNTLASAYALAGEYQRAIATAQSALDLASAAKDEELANHLRSQLEIYKKQIKH